MSKINLYLGDCMEAMKGMENNAYDLAIVDPPFGIGEFWKKDIATKWRGNKDWNESIPNDEYFKQVMRVSKNQIIFGGNYYTKHLPVTNSWLFWDKGISFKTNMSMGQLAWTSFTHAMRYKRWLWSGAITNGKRYGVHPCEMPIGLYEWLLMNYSKEGDKILDTHGGSMSISLACHNLDFDLDLWEIDKDYFEAGKNRLEKHRRQLKLF